MSPRRRTPRQQRSKDKVARILDAARAILVDEGAAALNTNHIAQRASVGVGSLYEYFPNKQAIISALIDQLSVAETDTMLARFADVETQPLDEAVRVLVATLFELYRRNHVLYRQLWSMSSEPREVGSRPGERLVMERMRSRLEPLVDQLGIDDLDRVVFTAFHMAESLCDRYCQRGVAQFGEQASLEEITRAVLAYLGLRPR